jgi:hypothetical protein
MDVVLDTRGDEWTVFRSQFDCLSTIVTTIACACLSCLFLTSAVFSIAASTGPIWRAVLWLVGSAALIVGGYLGGLAYFVAINDRYVAAGRVRRSSDGTAERTAIASIVWQQKVQHPHAVICAADGRRLLEISPTMSSRQAARIAEHLCVPFVSDPG